MKSKHFQTEWNTDIASEILFKYLWKIYKVFYYSLTEGKLFISKSQRKEQMETFMKVLKEWEFKLAKETFHGGKTPDAADFKCYSAIQMHQHMPSY